MTPHLKRGPGRLQPAFGLPQGVSLQQVGCLSQLGVMISLPLFKLPWNICRGKPHQIRHNLSDQSFSVFLRIAQAVVENHSFFLRRNMVFNKDRWIENRTSASDLVLPLICSGIRGQSLHLNRPQPPCERNENCVDFKAPFSSIGCGFTICRAVGSEGDKMPGPDP